MSEHIPRLANDRALRVRSTEKVCTAWVSVDGIRMANRTRMSPEAVEKKYRELLQLGFDQSFPPPNGYWDPVDGAFVILDGRHEYLAALMLGRDKLFVAWVEEEEEAS